MTSRPVGLSRDLPPKRVMRAKVDGNDLVVWRAADGAIAAWDNRCPHRGMSLSHGFVRGNMLACLYHGWHYGSSGRCRHIPAHPDLEPPATIQTIQHSVVEQDGVIWVSVDAEAKGASLGLDPLRSFIVKASEAGVRLACVTVLVAEDKPQEIQSGLYAVGSDTLAVLCNPLSSSTQVTVLVSTGLPISRRQALSRWCEAMRRKAEAEVGS